MISKEHMPARALLTAYLPLDVERDTEQMKAAGNAWDETQAHPQNVLVLARPATALPGVCPAQRTAALSLGHRWTASVLVGMSSTARTSAQWAVV